MTQAQSGISYSSLIVEALTRHGSKTAFVSGERTVTYDQAAELTGRIRQVLASRGIGPKGCLGALSPNAPEVWMVQAGACLNGAMYTGLHPLGSVDDHVQLCDDAEIQVLVVHPVFAEVGAKIVERASTVKHLLTLGPSEFGEDLLALCEQVEPEKLVAGPATEEDVAWLQYTGGTTGRPKGVMISHRAMVQVVYSLTASWRLPLDPVTLLATPITHAGVLPLLPTLLRGGTVVLQPSFVPTNWLQAVVDHGVNFTFAIPTLLYALLDCGIIDQFDLSTLETVVYGASPMSPSRLEEAIGIFGQVFLQGYGQTECVAMGTVLSPFEHDPDGRPGLLNSCGKAIVGTELVILNDQDQPAAPGEVGEICLRSASVMTGYWKREAETLEALRDGWLHTSDMGYADPEGYVHIVDRKKDMVISGGFNIYPREVEDVLSEHPGVSSCAVIGVPDPKWGEALKAFVVLHRDSHADVEELIASVKARKGSLAAPKTIEFVDALPQTSVGKIDKRKLRAPFWDGMERAVN